jgi:hypothetical protein
MVDNDGPPTDSTPAQVMAWLDSRHIRPCDYETDLAQETGYPEDAVPAEVYGADGDKLGGVVLGRIPNAVLLNPFGGEVVIYFFFDGDGRLVRHVVKAWWYYL